MSERVQRVMALAVSGDRDGLQKELYKWETVWKRQGKRLLSAGKTVEKLREMNAVQVKRIQTQRETMQKLEAQHADTLAKLNVQVARAQAEHQAQLGELVDENLRLRRKLRGEQ